MWLFRDQRFQDHSVSSDNTPYEKIGDSEPVSIADEVPFEIPQSWEWVRLCQIADNIPDAFADGPFGSNLKREHYTEKREVRLIQLSNIGENGWRNENTKYTTYAHAATLERSCVKAGSIVIAKMMPAGRAIIVPNIESDYILSSDAVKFVPHPLLNKEYLVFAINSPAYRDQVVSEAHGVTRVRTSLGKLQTYLIPIPPLEEQSRIVKRLNEVFPLIAQYESGENARLLLDKFFPEQLKKSILQMAVQGKLVQQDPSDEPASVLLERIRAEKERLIKEGKIKRDKNESVIFRRDNSHYEKLGSEEHCIDDEIPYDIPDSWIWCRIGNLFSLQAGKNVPSSEIKELEFKGSYPCFGGNGKRGYVSCYNHEGDYPLIGRQGALCGNINRATGRFYATEHAVCVEAFADTNISWACLFLKALDLNQYATATAQPGLAVANINKVLIPLPPLSEQLRIVERIESLLTIIDSL